MNISCQHILILSVLVILLSDSSTAVPRGDCAMGCLTGVFRCKRELHSGYRKNADCCEEYQSCYGSCFPGAKPSCNKSKFMKRGSWNKRVSKEVALAPLFGYGVDDADLEQPWEFENSIYP